MKFFLLTVFLIGDAALLAGCGGKPTSQNPPLPQPSSRATPSATQIVAGAGRMQAGGLTLDATISSAPSGTAAAGGRALQTEQGVNR